MTANQIAYHTLEEQKRANRENEQINWSKAAAAHSSAAASHAHAEAAAKSAEASYLNALINSEKKASEIDLLEAQTFRQYSGGASDISHAVKNLSDVVKTWVPIGVVSPIATGVFAK